MTVATYLVTGLLAALLVFSALLKLSARPEVVESYARVSVPAERLPILAIVLLVAAGGLLIGWAWQPLGLAAAIGLVLYFGLALVAHARHRDLAHVGTPLVILLLAVAASVLTGLTQ